MSRWEVRGTENSVQVDAPNWMMAVGSAMGGLGLSGLELSCLICDVQPDGVVRIYDPREDTALLVRELTASEAGHGLSAPRSAAAPHGVVAVAPDPQLGAAVPSAQELATGSEGDPTDAPDPDDPPDPSEAEDAPPSGDSAAPPTLAMPSPSLGPWDDAVGPSAASERFDDDDLAFIQAPSGGDTEAPHGIAEALFESTFDIAGADSVEAAAATALDVLLQFVPAESAAVLFASINDTGLRFLAARGPSADAVRNIVVPFDRGIAGFAHARAADLIVHNAPADPRHMSEVDDESGYRTRAILVASLSDEDGAVHGVIELLNPPERFHAWHLDAARSVARTLAENLGRHG